MVSSIKKRESYKDLVSILKKDFKGKSLAEVESELDRKWDAETIEKAYSDCFSPKKKAVKKKPSSKLNSKKISEIISGVKKNNSSFMNKAESFKSTYKGKRDTSFQTDASKVKVDSDVIRILTEKHEDTHRYLQHLFDKLEYKKHFYDSAKEHTKKAEDEKKNFDILKEAIRLAQDVVKNNKGGVQNQISQNAAPSFYPQPTQNIPSSQKQEAMKEENESVNEDVSAEKTTQEKSKSDMELEEQRLLLEEERVRLRLERERIEEERKRFEQMRLHPIKRESSERRESEVRGSQRDKKDDAHVDNLDSKLDLLEQKLKNYDYEVSRDESKYKNEMIVDDIEFVSEPVGDRAQTGIMGLDPIIQGGFRRLSTNLIAGGPGSGKTILGMQFLINGIEKYKEPGIFITFEQSKKELYDLFKDFNWNLKQLEKEKKLQILHLSPEQLAKMLTAGGGSLRDSIDNIHATRIVVDSITDLMMLCKTEIDKREMCVELFDLFKKLNCTTLITSEQEVNPLKHISNIMEYLVDGVILLYNERVGDIRQRAMEIFKMRGTKHAGRIFPMKINEAGLFVISNVR